MYCCITKTVLRTIATYTLCIVLCIAVFAFAIPLLRTPNTQQTVAAAKYEWGLSFQPQQPAPTPNRTAEQLAPYAAFYCGNPTQKRLYLTFDAGYENGNTPPILDALKKHHAPGAFFVVGPYIKENGALIQRMVAEGHTVGNHTYHHPNMTQKEEDSFKSELAQTEAVFQELIGAPMPRFYRPPEGKFSDENLQWAQQLGYKTVFWSLAYVDWNSDAQPTYEKAFEKLLPRTHNGAIVLLHSTSATNAAILDDLLTKWEEMGYTFGDISELGGNLSGNLADTADNPTAATNRTTPFYSRST